MNTRFRTPVAPLLVAGLFAASACEPAATQPDAAPAPVAFAIGADGEPGVEEFELCKVGTAANFDLLVVDNATGGTLRDETVALGAGECQVLIQIGGEGATVTVRERTEDFTNEQLDQVLVDVVDQTGTTGDFAGANPWTDVVGGDDIAIGNGPRGVTVTFFNSIVPPSGGEGCTPGYWKQSQHFDSWMGHAPSDPFDGVFDPDAVALVRPERGDTGDLTLLDGLGLRGGSVNALIRHTVAALLNASSVSYGLSEAEVLARYTAAVTGGDIEAQKDEFASLNEQGCPLN